MARRVLVVDDDPLIRELVGGLLRQRGVEVAEAGRAQPALVRLEADRFDLLITDVEMPGPSGLWLLGEVRRRWRDLPVILVTGWPLAAMGPDVRHAADAVLAKPFRAAELLARVEALLPR